MRIELIDLLRYGNFTDRPIALPKAACDIHVIVGPNEAGKSTLRSAVVDLLYGFPRSPPQAFLHPPNELRLGATIEHGDDRLEFHRTKGLKNTVRSLTDEPLPEGTLAPFLGPTDRGFFEQMFGLDRERLVAGGHSILTSGSDVGRILFAAASGIEGVSSVLAALNAEADTLWSPRRSKDRAFYRALDAFESAAAELKAATVRSKDWSEKQVAVTGLDEALAGAHNAYTALQAQRNTLERVRRVAPYLATLSTKHQALADLGAVPDLPASAAQTLLETEKAIALHEAAQSSQSKLQAEAAATLAAIRVDDAVLALAPEIRALDELRLQLRAHEGDIVRREAEVAALWKSACEASSQLEWPGATEAELRDRLPPLPRRKSLERLILEQGAIATSLQAATQAERTKSGELQRAEAQLKDLPMGEVPVALQAALTAAQQLGDAAGVRWQRYAESAKRQAAQEAALAALGAWSFDDVACLRAVMPPSAETLDAFQRDQATDDADGRAITQRIEALRAEVIARELEVAQYRETYHPVTRAEVLDKRTARDEQWGAIRHGRQSLDGAAAAFERLVAGADAAADGRETTVQEATTLQGKLHGLERLRLELSGHEAQLDRLREATDARATRWVALVESCGLPGMRPDAMGSWIEARKVALAASDSVEDAQRACLDWDDAIHARSAALVRGLQDLGLQPQARGEGGDGSVLLATLVLEAASFIESVGQARGQRRALQVQLADATLALVGLRRVLADTDAQMTKWSASWVEATAQMGIAHHDDAPADLGQAQGALELMARIDENLAEMHKLRSERIATMHADLARLSVEAARLVQAVAAELVGKPAADVASELALRLSRANEARAEARRQTAALEAARTKESDAQSAIEALQAGLRPLMERAGVASTADLRRAISRADAARDIEAAIALAEQGLHQGGDELPVAQLQAEADAVSLDQVLPAVQDLTSQMDDLLERQTTLSAERSTAEAALATIGGSADAATCEGRRQEALARMAEAVERYARVITAAHLLKWSIEQYRETRQGPMLKLAGAIFAGLTLNSFDALTVDFDSETLKLQGRRPGGARVDVGGMSDGTRDQLYLALRLAALDLHLGQAHALPFIADDLFVNYDNRRAQAGLASLGELSRKTQVIFLTHHEHLLPLVRDIFGQGVNVVTL